MPQETDLVKLKQSPSILLVAAEAREFSGLLARVSSQPFAWPTSDRPAFARETLLQGRRVILLANGPGPRLVNRMLDAFALPHLTAVVSTGFCGALDPALRAGDVLDASPSEIWSEDRVVVHAADKRQLRERTGARIVEMEYAAVAGQAAKWGLPCRAIRVVSDTAQEDLPLDLNRYRDNQGRFQLTHIALAGLLRPFTILPGLLRLERNSRTAAENLGAFLADCQF